MNPASKKLRAAICRAERTRIAPRMSARTDSSRRRPIRSHLSRSRRNSQTRTAIPSAISKERTSVKSRPAARPGQRDSVGSIDSGLGAGIAGARFRDHRADSIEDLRGVELAGQVGRHLLP